MILILIVLLLLGGAAVFVFAKQITNFEFQPDLKPKLDELIKKSRNTQAHFMQVQKEQNKFFVSVLNILGKYCDKSLKSEQASEETPLDPNWYYQKEKWLSAIKDQMFRLGDQVTLRQPNSGCAISSSNLTHIYSDIKASNLQDISQDDEQFFRNGGQEEDLRAAVAAVQSQIQARNVTNLTGLAVSSDETKSTDYSLPQVIPELWRKLNKPLDVVVPESGYGRTLAQTQQNGLQPCS